jgi:hypothetical protein
VGDLLRPSSGPPPALLRPSSGPPAAFPGFLLEREPQDHWKSLPPAPWRRHSRNQDRYHRHGERGSRYQQRRRLFAGRARASRQGNVDSLKEFDYFTYMHFEARTTKLIKLKPPVDYWIDYDKNVITLHFTLPLDKPVDTHGKPVAMDVYGRSARYGCTWVARTCAQARRRWGPMRCGPPAPSAVRSSSCCLVAVIGRVACADAAPLTNCRKASLSHIRKTTSAPSAFFRQETARRLFHG